MKRLCCLLCLSVVSVSARDRGESGRPRQAQPLRIIAFGAHPDDAELKASGVAALWAAAGHKVKFVAMTNGDVGHFGTAGGPWPAGARPRSPNAPAFSASRLTSWTSTTAS